VTVLRQLGTLVLLPGAHATPCWPWPLADKLLGKDWCERGDCACRMKVSALQMSWGPEPYHKGLEVNSLHDTRPGKTGDCVRQQDLILVNV